MAFHFHHYRDKKWYTQHNKMQHASYWNTIFCFIAIIKKKFRIFNFQPVFLCSFYNLSARFSVPTFYNCAIFLIINVGNNHHKKKLLFRVFIFFKPPSFFHDDFFAVVTNNEFLGVGRVSNKFKHKITRLYPISELKLEYDQQ